MDVDSEQMLIEGLADLLAFVWHHRAELADPGTDLREQLLERLGAVNERARVAARVHDYLPVLGDEQHPDPEQDSWGRRLSLHTLSALGVVGLVREMSGAVAPVDVVADLARYLAGPAVAGERMFVLDADLPLSGVYVIAGWRLIALEPASLEALTPLPSTRRFAANPWDEALVHGGCAVLRRVCDDLQPRVSMWFPAGLATDLTELELAIVAWEPLLLLNLAATERITVAVEYEIEPGRVVDRIRGVGLGLVEDGDDVNTWEVPAWGPYRPMDDELDGMLNVVALLEPLLAEKLDWQPFTGKERRSVKAGADGMRRSAHRMLSQGPRLGLDGDVPFPRDRAEVVFWLMSALENLTIPEGDMGDFTRKVAQRTAVLIGVDDADRLAINEDVIAGYRIRSKVAHGAVIPADQLDELPARLYGCLREVFRALIILGPRFDLATACDQALLSQSVRQQLIAGPVGAVVAMLPENHRSLRPGQRARRAARRRAT